MTTPDPRQIGCGGWTPPSQHAKEKADDRLALTAGSPSFSATSRTDAFCASLKGMGNWERWQKTASFAADLERELATVRRDLRGLMDEYADRRAQWGDEYLWGKHEDTELVEDIRRRILENETSPGAGATE